MRSAEMPEAAERNGVTITWDVPEEMPWDALGLFIGDDYVREFRRDLDDRARWDDDGGSPVTPSGQG